MPLWQGRRHRTEQGPCCPFVSQPEQRRRFVIPRRPSTGASGPLICRRDRGKHTIAGWRWLRPQTGEEAILRIDRRQCRKLSGESVGVRLYLAGFFPLPDPAKAVTPTSSATCISDDLLERAREVDGRAEHLTPEPVFASKRLQMSIDRPPVVCFREIDPGPDHPSSMNQKDLAPSLNF